MGLPIEFYVYVGYGLFAMLAVFFGLNFLLGGLLRPFLEVKRSRGTKLLVRVRHPVQDYFRAGVIEEGFLVYTNREKTKKRIPMLPGVVTRACTIYWTEVDDEKNCFFKRDTAEAVQTYDAARVDSYIVRALVRPGLFGDQTVKILLFLTIIGIVAIAAVGYLTYRNLQAVDAVKVTLQGLTTLAVNTTGVVA